MKNVSNSIHVDIEAAESYTCVWEAIRRPYSRILISHSLRSRAKVSAMHIQKTFLVVSLSPMHANNKYMCVDLFYVAANIQNINWEKGMVVTDENSIHKISILK